MENRIITLDDEIFKNVDKAIEFLIRLRVLREIIGCNYCGENMELYVRKSRLNERFYKCVNGECRRTCSMFKGFKVCLPKIDVRKILKAAYYFLTECNNFQVTIFVGIDEHTYIKLKNLFIESLTLFELQNQRRVGGFGSVWQVDETAVCRRGIITNPTSLEEEVRDTIWIIGIIEENSRELRMEVLPDRRVNTFSDFFVRNLLPGTTIKSDGYPSYPQAVRNANCNHIVVNHSVGFTNENGDHTNLIENVWAHLKTELRTRRGVMLNNMKIFVKEFILMRRNNFIRNRENTSSFFYKLFNSLSFDE